MRTSDYYVCTLDTRSIVDMEKLEVIRETIRSVNKTLSSPKRVCVKGRKAIVKENGRSYNPFGDVVGGLSNAKYFDVYIYDR